MSPRPDPEAPEGRGDGGAAARATYGERPAPDGLGGRVACLWWVTPPARVEDGPGVAAGGSQAPPRPAGVAAVRPTGEHARNRWTDADAGARRAGRRAGAPSGGPAAVAEIAAEAASTILPDGCVDLVWHGGALTVAGPDTRARPGVAGTGAALGVRLRPGAATTFGVSASALRDRHPTAEELWGAEGRRLTERVAGAADDRERLALLAHVVGRRAAAARSTDAAVDGTVALLAGGRTTVASAAEDAGVGERQLRRRFHEHVGYGPKTLDRVLRLQRLLDLAITTDEDLAGLAALAGYADQAHLGHEVRALAGTTPARLVAARRPWPGPRRAAAAAGS